MVGSKNVCDSFKKNLQIMKTPFKHFHKRYLNAFEDAENIFLKKIKQQ